MNEELLIERVTSAERPRHPTEIASHPVWLDLSESGRVRAYERTIALRKVEGALDPRGLTTTAHAVLAKLPK